MSGAPMRRLPLVLVVALFFLWGVANNLNDVLIAHFKKLFVLSDLGAGLVQSAFYLGYFCLAIPAALTMRRFGYRAAVLLGLLLYGAGALMFWPAAAWQSYPAFLLALFVIASGLGFLETSANPLMAKLGSEDSAARRLNLAQAFNPLGSITGVLIGSQFILSGQSGPVTGDAARAAEAAAVQLPYLVIGLGVLVWAVLIRLTPFPPVATERDVEEGVGAAGDFAAVMRSVRVRGGVAAQFFYVGAQVGIWSFLIRYSEVAVPGTGERTAAHYLTLSLVLFMAGRFAGTALMTRVAPARLLAAFAAIAGALTLAAALLGGGVGIVALVATSFFMSIMYPTIFAEAVRDLGALTKSAAALLVMAIVGGAVFPALMGLVSDRSGSIIVAMVVPAACFAVVLFYALSLRRGRA
ncbi:MULTISPECIES: L-fucose:H+ symporter permease [unclassified Sphingomonas]|uniref:L-fucose:H+ symporter permease n=1 Tax=unclassified Sphingomonas TaxID=196159 RepID=UPI0016111AE1|nr:MULTISPECIES: L-fucose:H+ symporter permease [unclassified Sphingomonas]MBB3348490.1 FHS family L-fucose permease-like MFS transporter [Sphingomonas sp. BK069]MBB3474954.1 FHS family L-fucose permease-like MFS transporter [Sphingomonas sp. BK345]